MACTADRLVASPFAILGSIGVISEQPNVYERLKREGVEFQTVTAGKYKRTLTPTKKPDAQDAKKFKEDIEAILVLFKKFVGEQRPSLDIDRIATGETWFGEDALANGLVDELKTVDEVLLDLVDAGSEVYSVAYDPAPAGLPGPLGKLLPSSSTRGGSRLWRAANAIFGPADAGFDAGAAQRYMLQDDTAERVKVWDERY